uniref:Uncharacterized protein n=1 Tax=Arundo donax TaxID=35708 RepID=A0A0A9D863_ARUDO
MRQTKMFKLNVLSLGQLLFLHQLMVMHQSWSLKMLLTSRQRYLTRRMRG